MFFWGISLGLLIENGSSACSFYLYFSYSEFRKTSYILWLCRAVYMWGCPFVACLGLIHLIWGHFLVWMPRASFFSVYWFLSPWWECTYAGAYCPVLRFAVVAQGHPWGRRWERTWLLTILESAQAAVGACDCSWVLAGRWWGLATILGVWNGSGGGWRALEAHAAGSVLSTASTHTGERDCNLSPTPLLVAPPKQWYLASKVAQASFELSSDWLPAPRSRLFLQGQL